MFGFLEALPLSRALPYVILLICAALLRWSLAGDASGKAKPAIKEIALEEILITPSLDVPEEPHVEIALDGGSKGMGGLHHSNPTKPYGFQTDCCSGSYIFLNAPTAAPGACNEEAQGLNFRDYFRGKSRLWELRIHLRFNESLQPEEELHFGVELESYAPMNGASRRFCSLAVAAIRQAVGQVYHSVGDDPSKVTAGEVERPTGVLPLGAFDQFVETPKGEEPPRLTDPNFSQLGCRRYQRRKEYAKEIDELRTRIRPGVTYTFAFWGTSRFMDVINWRIVGLPMAPPLDFDRFAGRPPVHVTLYSLTPPEDGDADTRHVQSRKKYIFRFALWSSQRRPERETFERCIGVVPNGMSTGNSVAKKKRSLKGRIVSFFESQMQCCAARPR